MIEQKDNVNTACTAYNAMSAKWQLLHDLLGGTYAMRLAGTKWLPQEQDEKELNYKARLGRSILFGALSDTVEKLTSKPFAKAVSLQGVLPDQLAPIENDVDGSGYTLTQFAKDAFRSAAKYGLTHILVDYPKAPPGVDLGTERQLALRPKFVLIEPTQLIGWTTEKAANGQPKLTSIRIREQETRSNGKYGDKTVEQVRVYTETAWELWELTEKDWEPVDNGKHSFKGVPLATCYFQRSGFMQADLPLEDLAWLNLAHWQSMSDQRNILRFARFGLLFAKGFDKKDVDKGFAVGPNQLIHTTNIEADMKYVEHTGTAIGAGENDLRNLEQRMEVLGMQPLMRQTGDVKATGQAINESKAQSEIHAWIRNLEGTLRQAFNFAAMWVNAQLPDDFKVDIFSEFSLVMGASGDTDQLLKAYVSGAIDHETYLVEIKRRGLIAENSDIEQIKDRVAEETPSPSDFGLPAAGDQPGTQQQNGQAKE